MSTPQPLDAAMVAAMTVDRSLRGEVTSKDLGSQRHAGLLSARYWCADLGVQVSSEDILIAARGGNIRARIYSPRGIDLANLPRIVVVHGGAFTLGSIEQAEPAAARLAAETPAIVISVTYRLAPEHAFPAALEDVEDAIAWASRTPLGDNHSGALAVLGISAGANLIAASLTRRPEGVACAVLVYGLLSARTDTESHRLYGDGDYGLTSARIREAFDLYAPHCEPVEEPLLSPLRADHSGFPPTCLIAAGCDPLRDDSRLMHDALQRAGVDSTLIEVHGMAHGFINKGRMVPQALETLGQVAGFLRIRLTSHSPRRMEAKEEHKEHRQ